jgi:transposase-like protein
MSGYGRTKMGEIIRFWLDRAPREKIDLSRSKYVLYDGTYFHKNGCFISLMDSQSQQTISHVYAQKEGFTGSYKWFRGLREAGLYPLYMTMDGERQVMKAIREVWPDVKIQRCLYHIQREGLRWLRTYPKTQAGRELRIILKSLCRVDSVGSKERFLMEFRRWLERYWGYVRSLPWEEVAGKDLKRTMGLITNAIPNMFYFLEDPCIQKTTNQMESFYSRLKADYRRHRGLTEKHKISYLAWYAYFHNRE